MNGREALRALADGKKVVMNVLGEDQYGSGTVEELDASKLSVKEVLDRDGWGVVEKPLTDEQLIAEWERLATVNDKHGNDSAYYVAAALRQCAGQLRERKL